MSLFQCEVCGCVENTALSDQGHTGMFEEYFDWTYAPERRGLWLCSECGPPKHTDGTDSDSGKWHGQFDKVYLPLGMFKTNQKDGGLIHKENGDTEWIKYKKD